MTRRLVQAGAVLQGVLIGLRLGGLVDWSWWWVFAPAIGLVGILVLAFLAIGIGFTVLGRKIEEEKRKLREAPDAKKLPTYCCKCGRHLGGPDDPKSPRKSHGYCSPCAVKALEEAKED